MAKEQKTPSMKDIQKVLMELAQAQKKTEEAQQRTEKAQQRTEEAQQRTEEARMKGEKELRKSIKDVNDKYGNLSNNWGDMLEGLLEGDLLKLLQKQNIKVKEIQPQLRFPDGEFDLVATNEEEMVAIEAKTTLKQDDIDYFLGQLKKFKSNPPTAYRGQTIYGGVGFIKGRKEVIKYAEKKGLFVIRCTGGEKNISTIVNSKGFVPRKL